MVFVGTVAALAGLCLTGCETPNPEGGPPRAKAVPPRTPSPRESSSATMAPPSSALPGTNRFLPLLAREWERTGTQPNSRGQIIQTYRITLQYPEFLGPGCGGLNQTIKGFVEETKGDFIASASNLSEATLASPTLPWSLAMKFSVASFSPRFTSLLFELRTVTGNPSNQTDFYSINYDLEHQTELAITNLLASPEAFTQLAYRVVKKLADQPGAAASATLIARGAGPDPANYFVFTVTPTQLEVYFPAGQVNPPGGGPKNVVLPLPEIANLLAPQFLALLQAVPPP